MKPLLCLGTLAVVLAMSATQAAPQSDASQALSEASTLSLEGGVALVEGLAAGSGYVLQAVRPLGEGVLAVFVEVGGSARLTLELSGEAARWAGRHVGAAIEVVAAVGGSALMLAGEMIAFIPDSAVQAMHYRQRVSP